MFKIIFILIFFISRIASSCFDAENMHYPKSGGDTLVLNVHVKEGVVAVSEDIYKEILLFLVEEDEFLLWNKSVRVVKNSNGMLSYLVPFENLELHFMVSYYPGNIYPVIHINNKYLEAQIGLNQSKKSCSKNVGMGDQKSVYRKVSDFIFSLKKSDYLNINEQIIAYSHSEKVILDEKVRREGKIFDKIQEISVKFGELKGKEKRYFETYDEEALNFFSSTGVIYLAKSNKFLKKQWGAILKEQNGPGYYYGFLPYNETLFLEDQEIRELGYSIRQRVIRLVLGFLGAQINLEVNEYDSIKAVLINFMKKRSQLGREMSECLPVKKDDTRDLELLSFAEYPLALTYIPSEKQEIFLPFLENPACSEPPLGSEKIKE